MIIGTGTEMTSNLNLKWSKYSYLRLSVYIYLNFSYLNSLINNLFFSSKFTSDFQSLSNLMFAQSSETKNKDNIIKG